MKKLLFFILILLPIMVKAQDITKESTYEINEQINGKIQDNKENTYVNLKSADVITIKSNNKIKSLYIIYELKSTLGIINYNDKETKIGTNGFLHEYIELEEETNEITIKYDDDVKIADIYVFDNGELPQYVEVWNPPCEEADLVLFSTHSDDEQLFFLGLLPTYVAKGAQVQVVYFTNHYDNPKRLHEQLHGLYTVGIRNYPIIGIIPDAYSESLEGAINNLKKANLTEEDALKFEVEMIRRFKPLVIVGHDELGEYSHGQHILNTYILKEAINKANNKDYDLNSYNQYGLWNTPKLYLHLYKENPIVMDYDTPLEYFNGKTAYEVSKEGYSKHLSQQWTWFTGWINGKNNEYTKSTDIKTYSPNEFGLYRSLVGEDINKNDMFENLTLRKEQIKEEEKEEVNNNNNDELNNNNSNNPTHFIILIILVSIFILLIIFVLKRKRNYN